MRACNTGFTCGNESAGAIGGRPALHGGMTPTRSTAAMATRSAPRSGRRRLREARVAVVVAAATVAVRSFLLVPVGVHGESMEPTVHDGDVVVVTRTAAAADELRRGDLVVFRDPQGSLSVKLVVGLPGDRVAMLDARLTVDGEFVDEPYVDLSRID